MESAVCVSGFLLLLFSTGVHLSPHPKQEFGFEGRYTRFDPSFSSVDDYVLYRVCGDGDLLLLINCSQPERPQPDGYEVKCVNNFTFYFNMYELTMSHSGDYRAEVWRGKNITEHTSFRLTVCAERGGPSYQNALCGGAVELFNLNSSLGNGSSLQLYRYDTIIDNYILVLDTNSSLEPLVEDLKGRLQVDLNTSLLTLFGVTERDSVFFCTVWRGAQCQSGHGSRLYVFPKPIFTHEEENVTLPCISIGQLPDQVYWTTPTGSVQPIINQTRPQEVMYMLDGSQTGDSSLIIPSVSLQHSGEYTCRGSLRLKMIELYVCTKLSPSDVMFSPGQGVLLDINEHMRNFSSAIGIYIYRLQPQALLLDLNINYTKTHSSVPDDLSGRVKFSKFPNISLMISNLTAKDSGVYAWRVYGEGGSGKVCSEGSFHLVYLDPLGVHSPFYRAYAPLIGCGLLGLVAAVIWLKLRSRRGEQTSGRQGREGQQSGDEDLNDDDVEMAELNTPLSAEAVEHSV